MPGRHSATRLGYPLGMVNGSTNVFRIRQAVSDLRSLITSASDASLTRMMSDVALPVGGDKRALRAVIDGTGGRFSMPRDEGAYEAVLLAAAQPDMDFPAFVVSTALLLADRLQDGQGGDDLYWNWESFRDHYALADPPARAALMNGFRVGAETGRVLIDPLPDPDLCLTRPIQEIVGPATSGHFVDLVRRHASARVAGRLWAGTSLRALAVADVRAARYLYERPASMAPLGAERVHLIPWSAE